MENTTRKIKNKNKIRIQHIKQRAYTTRNIQHEKYTMFVLQSSYNTEIQHAYTTRNIQHKNMTQKYNTHPTHHTT